jgi:DDE superfamily endonuclease
MDQLIPSFAQLIAKFAPCFRVEVFQTFTAMVAAWLVCLGRRSISRVWETTGQARQRNHKAAFRLFSAAAWDWDELACILCTLILTHLVPGAALWVVVDDTLCHKRGAKVAFGGIFLDAVLSSKRHKVFRFGNNWVMLGIVVQIPCRADRYFCLPVLWRVYEKKDKQDKQKAAAHRTKGQLAAELVLFLAEKWPTRKLIVVADSAYVGQHLLQNRPANLHVLGPIRWDAALSTVALEPGKRVRGKRLPTPKQLLADERRWPMHKLTVSFGTVQRELNVKVVTDVCWDHAAGRTPLQLVLVRDPLGKWRDEALVSTDLSLSAEEMIVGYCRRWSVEVAFCEAKQLLGFHDPQVRCELSVERAAPLSWFLGSLVVLWYVLSGKDGPQAERERPWYKHKVTPTFADMLASCRLHHWQAWLDVKSASKAQLQRKCAWLFNYIATAA